MTAAALLAACGAELPTSAELEGMDVTGAERRLGALTSDGAVTYMLNGKEISAEEARALPSVNIASLDVRRLNGKRNVISIRTNAKDSTNAANAETANTIIAKRVAVTVGPNGIADSTRRITMSSAGASPKPFEGLMIIDGVKSTAAALNAISPDKIVSVEVVKGTAGLAKYGADGAKGVIVVTTKK